MPLPPFYQILYEVINTIITIIIKVREGGYGARTLWGLAGSLRAHFLDNVDIGDIDV
jgi:hypothetical protein